MRQSHSLRGVYGTINEDQHACNAVGERTESVLLGGEGAENGGSLGSPGNCGVLIGTGCDEQTGLTETQG